MPSSSHTAAVQHIYEQHHSWLRGWLKGKLHNASDAADVAHDTFVRMLGGRHAAQILEPRDYLATIARGLVIDRYRRHAIEQAYRQTLVAVDKALSGLGERFVLAQIEGLTYQQIADQLQVSLTTVKKHMIRALTECSLIMASR